ncbi:MAG: TldD/PmbA family protein [Phycisphaerales bacterium]|nr:TldD/PmbA family protein [Phycisphaerales bacterium]
MPEPMSRAEFARIAEIAFQAATGEQTFVSVSDEQGGTTRFANNQVSQNVHIRRQSLTVSAAFGRRHGRASTTELTDAGIRAVVAAAEELARVAPEDPEYLPPLGPQNYPRLASHRPETAAAGPSDRIERVRIAVEACRAARMQAAGAMEAYAGSVGIAAAGGLFAFEARTRCQFTVTATASDSSGWAGDASRSVDDLDVAVLTQRAIDKARASASPTELPPGRYSVLLEPAAVAGLVGPLMSAMDARSYHRGTSALRGRLGERIIDERLTLRNRPDHPSLLGAAFNGEGLSADYHAWIESGVLRRLNYDRFTAMEHGVQPSADLDAAVLEGREEAPRGARAAHFDEGRAVEGRSGGAADLLEELIASTKRGILVTNFWYIRPVNATDLTLTGMTRDGLFLVEDGRIGPGLLNFRWHDSPLRALNAIEAFTRPLDAVSWERDKMMLPALRVGDFNFSSVTRF